PLLNTANFTIECWAKATDLSGLIAPSSTRAAMRGAWFWNYPAGNWSAGVSVGGQNYYVPSATSKDAAVVNQWVHLVLTGSTAQGLRVYVNGEWDNQSYADFDHNNSGPLIIGALGVSIAPQTVDLKFIGTVDEVAVYTRALSLATIQSHY